MDKVFPLVISASRRTDLVGCYPEYFIEKLQQYPPENVHTVVIWTKNPYNMIINAPLRESLARYSQLYIHLTVTGLGGTLLEPRIPRETKVLEMLPALVELVKSAERISWRFDPIVSAQVKDKSMSNYPLFPAIARQISSYGITTCRTSWASPYKKVINRMQQKGVILREFTHEEQTRQAAEMETVATQLGMKLFYCSMEGFERSRCIDGELLSRLHPEGLPCSTKRAKGQRKACGCTESLDIGWYSLKCNHGCLYCYAEPAAF
jgi:hypothetical protein